MGRFASGITVVTTVIDGKTHGMTANAFVSVSLEPPLVLVSVANKAHMHGYLSRSGRYGVSVLTATQEAYSQHFAGFGAPDFEPEFVEVGGIPLLAESLAHLVVKVTDAHVAGDHTLYIGEVEYVKWWDGQPLLYFQGQYAQL
ncbi:MAG: flavin reductase family protein [Caldilineaceae bacterium]|nr:flavin reductase family protein [Caldilineaceae bacterium]